MALEEICDGRSVAISSAWAVGVATNKKSDVGLGLLRIEISCENLIILLIGSGSSCSARSSKAGTANDDLAERP